METSVTGCNPKSNQILEWIQHNKEIIDSYDTGNMAFSWTNNALKVRIEKIEKIEY